MSAPRPERMTDLADLLESRATAIHEWLTNDESSGIIEILHDDDHDPPAIAYALMREAAETIRRLRADGATLRERVKDVDHPGDVRFFTRGSRDENRNRVCAEPDEVIAMLAAYAALIDSILASAPKEPTP